MEKFTDWDLLAKYFANECSLTERKQIDNWFQESNENEEIFNELQNIWTNSKEIVKPKINKKEAWNSIQQQIDKTQKNTGKHKNIFFKCAAAILIFIIASFMLSHSLKQDETNKIISHNKISIKNDEPKPKKVVLPDNSIVWLNSNASITYLSNFNNKRNLELKGEAFFDVKKDKEHPFVIATGSTKTKVLGTSFNIKQNGIAEIEIAVFTGKVEFSNKSNKVFLAKNDLALYSSENDNINTFVITDKNLLSWKTGILTFEDDNLEYISKILSCHYNKKISLESTKLSKISFTSTFKDENLENVLDIISQTLDLRIITKENQIILKTK